MRFSEVAVTQPRGDRSAHRRASTKKLLKNIAATDRDRWTQACLAADFIDVFPPEHSLSP
jgi:hypothetical protein